MLWKLRLAAGLVLAPGLLVPQAALGAGAGSFGPTGSMGAARYAAAAAPLPNGRVLVAGGYYDDGGDHYLASAEVFNSATNAFSSAGIGAMGTARRGAVAAPLPDGRVLVAGGSYDDGTEHYLASAEVFNPATGVFTPVNDMGVARVRAAAAPLRDGRVLVAGGTYGADRHSSAAVFDPATNTFSSAGIGAMGTARRGAVAAPLPDGRVLVAGGYYYDGVDHYLASAEVFSPTTNAFTPVNDMGVARVRAVAAPLPDGRVLVAGGNNGSTRLSSAEVFNPSTGAFTPVSDMGTDRARAAAAPLPDGRVLLAGGTSEAPLASAEIFNPATNTFSSTGIGNMGTARRAPAAAPLPDGRVLVAGGSYDDPTEHYLASAEVFNPATNSFSSAGIGAMGTARTGAAAAPLPDGRVLVAGGFDGSTRFSSAEIFAATNAFNFALKGRKLLVSVQATGRLSVSDAAARLNASVAKNKKKKRRLLLKSSDASGDPPTITVALHLSKLASQRLRRTGKVAVRARITFAPQGGLANTQTAKLKIKGRKKK